MWFLFVIDCFSVLEMLEVDKQKVAAKVFSYTTVKTNMTGIQVKKQFC